MEGRFYRRCYPRPMAAGNAERMETDALVVGAGVAGLACAHALAENGLAVVVAEREAMPGGRARSWTSAATGDVVDLGPHVVTSEYRNFLALCDRLGTRRSITWQPGKLLTLVCGGKTLRVRHRPLPPPLSLLPDFAFAPELGTADMISNGMASARALAFDEADVAELDSTSALDFLRSLGVTEKLIDWFWRFTSMALLNVPLERCSAAAMLRVYRGLIGYRRLHFGFPATGLAELFAPACGRRIGAAGGRLLTEADVVAIRQEDGRHVATLRDGREIGARHCVLALPPQALGELVPGLADAAAFEASPYVSVYLWLDRHLTDERFWALLWTPSRLNYDFYDLSNIRPSLAGRDSVIASNIIYSHEANAMTDDAIVAATMRELAEFVPSAGSAKVRNAEVHRIPMGIACPTVGTEILRPGCRTRIPHLLLAGDWTRTGLPSSMESAARSGFLAAESVLADEGRPVRLAREPPTLDGIAAMVQAGAMATRALSRPSASAARRSAS